MAVDGAIHQKVLKLHYKPITLRMFTERIKRLTPWYCFHVDSRTGTLPVHYLSNPKS